jgi:hypothetical protein
MKGDITLKILETIKDGAGAAFDFTATFLEAGSGASSGKFDYLMYKRQRRRELKDVELEELRRLKRRSYSFFQSLKRDGLVEGNIASPKITLAGRFKAKKLRNQKDEFLPARDYSLEKSDNFVIVIFDIPESRRRKRAWLRATLRNMGFKKTQQSVWKGKGKVPKRFIDDLGRFKLLDCVEIFKADKLGTLK